MTHDEQQKLIKELPHIDQTAEAMPRVFSRVEVLSQMETVRDMLKEGQLSPGMADQIQDGAQEQKAEQENAMTECNEDVKVSQRTNHPQQEGKIELETNTPTHRGYRNSKRQHQ